jgi:hypothetical protein
MRQAAEVAQIVGEVRVIRTKRPLAGFDGLFQGIALGAQARQVRHGKDLWSATVGESLGQEQINPRPRSTAGQSTFILKNENAPAVGFTSNYVSQRSSPADIAR